MEKKFDVTVIIATYNPKYDKLLFTLDSIIKQKNVNMEIIVVDDGSKDNLFDKEIKYFENNSFKDYFLIDHKENKGTVLNLFDGLKRANGKYIKLISPGDALTDEYILCDWKNHLDKSTKKWSFSDLYYYKSIDDKNNLCLCSERATPSIIKYYKNKNDKKCRLNYLLYEEVATGAAILCDKDVMIQYFEKIVNKVIYAEDMIYRLMMFDNILPSYYPEKTIFYEYGTGISTSGNEVWNNRIKKDNDITKNIMRQTKKEGDLIQEKVIKEYSKADKRKSIFYINLPWKWHCIKIRLINRKTAMKIERRYRNESD